MSDQPITHAILESELARFYREVIRPDMERVLEDVFKRRIKPRFDTIDGHCDAIASKLDRLQGLAEETNASVARIDACLERMTQPFRDPNLHVDGPS